VRAVVLAGVGDVRVEKAEDDPARDPERLLGLTAAVP
jgi:hypothetical protein